LSIRYSVIDDIIKSDIGEIWVNFTPSEKLWGLLDKEIENAIRNEKS